MGSSPTVVTMKKSALDQVGHLLFSPHPYPHHFFRVYSEDKKSFVDYNLSAEDIKVKIVDKWVALEESEDGNRLTWSDRTLGQ